MKAIFRAKESETIALKFPTPDFLEMCYFYVKKLLKF